MPVAATLDLDRLLAPIPGDNPAGDPQAYAYTIRQQLDELRKDERAEDFDDATRPEQLKKADWPAAARLCQEALAGQSKDVRIACHLAEAQVKLQGFAGLRDSLTLLRRLTEECWDRLLPSIADGDLGSRAEPLANMLDDDERGIRFPYAVRCLPLFGKGDGARSYQDWSQLRGAKDADAKSEFDKAVAATSLEELEPIAAALDECQTELAALLTALDARLESAAPALTHLAAAISDCRGLARQELGKKAPAPAPAASDDERGAAPAGRADILGSRSEAYQQLNRVADFLQQLEPHSPVPYLVKRAVELGGLPFPRLMQQLIRDVGVLTELNREMGVQTAAEAVNSA